MRAKEQKEFFIRGEGDDLFKELYGREPASFHRERWLQVIQAHEELTEGAVPRLFSAPGRTELIGNHTDHNQGKVLAAAVHLDTIAAVSPREDGKVELLSQGYPPVRITLDSLEKDPGEQGQTQALVRGVAASAAARGGRVGGFSASTSSRVLKGSGLSSSAALEVLTGSIFNQLYNHGRFSSLEIAIMGQEAENDYFGKPCGLMDQAACAHGGAVSIDFAIPGDPKVQRIKTDFAEAGYTLMVVDSGGDHADLTPDYAAIPQEMRAVAGLLGGETLREKDEAAVLAQWQRIRREAGDRALLRSLHFFRENRRVEDTVKALEKGDIQTVLRLIKASGASSFQYLQNVYSPRETARQGTSLALALTEEFLGDQGSCRLHGGGFAGTILVLLPLSRAEDYHRFMRPYFGKESVYPLMIRQPPAGEIILER